MSPGPPPARGQGRRVTHARRGFDCADLAALAGDERRKLVQALLQERGAHVVEFQSQATHDELVAEITPLWRRRTIRIRVAAQELDQPAVDRLEARVREAGDTEGVMVAALGSAGDLSVPAPLSIIQPEDLITRLERSGLVSWDAGRPTPSYEMLVSQHALDREAALLDPIGLRWLPTLALNELPPELADVPIAADKLLERVAFRLVTSSLRFGGERHGESTPGQRLPDATLLWPAASGLRLAALFDAKAAGGGYTMTSDHLLRFCNYVESRKTELARAGYELTYLVILSSSFPGSEGAQHPFHRRARELASKVGAKLVYLRAIDLTRLAVAIEAHEVPPIERELLPWTDALEAGLIGENELVRRLLESA